MTQLDQKWHVMNKGSEEIIWTAPDPAALAQQTICSRPLITATSFLNSEMKQLSFYVVNLVVHHRDPCEHWCVYLIWCTDLVYGFTFWCLEGFQKEIKSETSSFLWNVWIIYKVKLQNRALKTLKSLGWESGECPCVCVRACVCALCTLQPTRIHPQLPGGGTIPQPTTSIHRRHPVHTRSLPSFLLLFPPFLPSFLSLSAPLSPQITAVFTRALRDLPTRPRVRSHSPHQAKKNPPKS